MAAAGFPRRRWPAGPGSLEADVCLSFPACKRGQGYQAWGPGGTHIGVAGTVPPSLAQAVLAPDRRPGNGGGQQRNGAGGVGSEDRSPRSPGSGAWGLTWGCRSDGWRRTRRRRTSGCSRPTGSTGPRRRPRLPAATRRGRRPACSTTAGGMMGRGESGFADSLGLGAQSYPHPSPPAGSLSPPEVERKREGVGDGGGVRRPGFCPVIWGRG